MQTCCEKRDAGIREWHIVISGFLQSEGQPTGMVALWQKLHSLASRSVCVELRSWCSNWNDVAEMIWRTRGADSPIVKIYAYSWGGWSAVLLARELKRRGMCVRVMVLCDPVYRHWYKLGQWRAMVPGSKIEIPDNVSEVYWLRQTNPRFRAPMPWWNVASCFCPSGHEVVAEDSAATTIHAPFLLRCAHTYADDAPAFHAASLEVAELP